jgi:hypothetical protein
MKHIRIYENFDPDKVPKIGDYICQERWIRDTANFWRFFPILKVINNANKYDYIQCEYITINELREIAVSIHDEIRFAKPKEIEEYELRKSAIIYNL